MVRRREVKPAVWRLIGDRLKPELQRDLAGRERWARRVVVSAGAAHLTGEGATTDPTRAVAYSGTVWSALGAAGIAAALRLAPRTWLGAELDAIVTVPPLVIHVADTDYKPFSGPGVLLDVGLHFDF